MVDVIAPWQQRDSRTSGSARWPQTRDGDDDEPPDGGLGGKAGRGGQRVDAIARELVGRDVVTHLPVGGALAQEVADEGAKLMVRVSDMLVPVQERGDV